MIEMGWLVRHEGRTIRVAHLSKFRLMRRVHNAAMVMYVTGQSDTPPRMWPYIRIRR